METPGLTELAGRKCRPCAGGAAPFPRERSEALLRGLADWRLEEGAKSIRADYLMSDFAAALELVGAVGTAAEGEDHHPDVHLTGYRRLAFVLSTHAVGGLSENDFILAAKISLLPKKLKV